MLRVLIQVNLIQGLIFLNLLLPALHQGLVELIVLNVGLEAGVLDQQLFATFVIMCLVTTFMATPL